MLQPRVSEKPLYILPQLKKRAIIPKMISLMFLGFIFYMGVLFNLILLDFSNEIVELAKILSMIIIVLLVGIGVIASISRSKRKYFFYRNKIIFKKKQILYSEITNTEIKQNVIDKLFKTYSIKLNKKFSIKHISKNVNISNYIKNMIDYVSKYN